MRTDIVVKFPFGEGELHVKATEVGEGWQFRFIHARQGTAWDALVEAAKGILNQEKLRNYRDTRRVLKSEL